MRQWWIWLFGEKPMPDKHSRLMLGATAVVVVLLVVGLAVVLRSPAPTTNAAPTGSTSDSNQIPAGNLNSTLNSVASSSGSSEGSGGASGASGVTTVTGAGSATGTGKGSHSRADRSGAKTKGTAGGKKKATTTTTTAAANQAVAATVQPFANSTDVPAATTNLPDLVPGFVPAVPAPSVVAVPGAPTVIKATSGHGSSRVTWSVPSNQGTSPITGYNVYVGTVSGSEYAEPVNGPLPITGTSYLVSSLTVGTTYYFTVKAINAVGLSAPSNEVSATPGNSYRSVGALTTPVVSMAANPQGSGYWLVNSGGAVATHGGVSAYGSTAGLHLNAPIEQIVATSDGKGYWEVANDGGIFAFGDAGFYGSMGGVKINAPVVGLAPTADGNGYWEVASDGGIFAFGDATFDGSMGGVPLNHPVVGMALDPVSGGYWEVAGDGGVFAFGGAPFLGSPTNLVLANPVVGIAAAATGEGYWEVASDGGIFSYGSAAFRGSTGSLDLNAPVAGMAVDQGSGGYWLFALDGGIFAFGAPFHGAG
jgi:hypothetical protein